MSRKKKGIASVYSVYRKNIQKYPLLTEDEEKKLFIEYKKGNSSIKDKIICSNLRLVIDIASKFDYPGTDIMELIQSGNEGLLDAIDRFDVDKGFKFSTYATPWIKSRIYRDLHIYLSKPKVWQANRDKLKAMGKVIIEERDKLGRNLTNKDLERLFEKDDIIEYKNYQMLSNMTSLDLEINEDGDNALIDLVPDDKYKPVLEDATDNVIHDMIMDAINELDERAKKIILRHYGLVDGIDESLGDIGKEDNITRQRVSQLEQRAFKQLRIKLKKRGINES